MVAVVEKIRTALLTASDIYLLSTFRLPPKQGGVLFGLYSRQDNTRWLEASVVGKINKGTWVNKHKGLNFEGPWPTLISSQPCLGSPEYHLE